MDRRAVTHLLERLLAHYEEQVQVVREQLELLDEGTDVEWIREVLEDEAASTVRRLLQWLRHDVYGDAWIHEVLDEAAGAPDARESEQDLAQRLIARGYRMLARECHPDTGGSNDEMRRLNEIRDRLTRLA